MEFGSVCRSAHLFLRSQLKISELTLQFFSDFLHGVSQKGRKLMNPNF